jgi:cytochrome c biogenesis factor
MWGQFVLVGILVSAAAWVYQRRQWSHWSRLFALTTLAAVIGAFLLMRYSYLTMGEAEPNWYAQAPYREIALFLLMVLGMCARNLTLAIEARRAKIEQLQRTAGPFEKPKLDIDGWEFAYPLFASVVTYGAVLSQTHDEVLTVTNVVLSFQMGFFWQTVLEQRRARLVDRVT